MMGALKYVKWPVKSQFDDPMTKTEWEWLDNKMRDYITERVAGCDTQQAVFALGELMAELHSQKTKTGNVKNQRKLGLQHDYTLFVYDLLFERIL
jgi:hypothetical protein